MYELRVCFEIAAHPCPVGVEITIGESLNEVPYEELVKCVKIDSVASMLRANPEHITIITPEEYDERYGDEE